MPASYFRKILGNACEFSSYEQELLERARCVQDDPYRQNLVVDESAVGRMAADNYGLFYDQKSYDELSSVRTRRQIPVAYFPNDAQEGKYPELLKSHSDVVLLSAFDRRGNPLSLRGRLYGIDYVQVLTSRANVSGNTRKLSMEPGTKIPSSRGIMRDPVEVYVPLRELTAATGLNEESLSEKVLTTKERANLPDSVFVYPEERRYPIHDISHARNALARVAQYGTAAEKKRVRASVYARYPSLAESKIADAATITRTEMDDFGDNFHTQRVFVDIPCAASLSDAMSGKYLNTIKGGSHCIIASIMTRNGDDLTGRRVYGYEIVEVHVPSSGLEFAEEEASESSLFKRAHGYVVYVSTEALMGATRLSEGK